MVLRRQHRRNPLRSMELLENRRLLSADLNGDGRVGFGDFLLLAEAFGDEVPLGTPADIDGDGVVSFSDFTILSNSYGGSVVQFERVPFMEPTNPEKFHAEVRSTQEWQALARRTNPETEIPAPPVSLEESMLLFVSLGETALGIWVDIEWVTRSQTRIDVGYRVYIGGPPPPPGSQVATSLVALPTSELPVHFVQLATIPLP